MYVVSKHSSNEILDYIESLGGCIPKRGKYLLVLLKNTNPSFNIFNDSLRVFDGHTFILESSIAISIGELVEEHFEHSYKNNKKLILSPNQFIKDCFSYKKDSRKRGYLTSSDEVLFYEKATEKLIKSSFNIQLFNFNPFSETIKENVLNYKYQSSAWSIPSDFRNFMEAVSKKNKRVDLAIINQ